MKTFYLLRLIDLISSSVVFSSILIIVTIKSLSDGFHSDQDVEEYYYFSRSHRTLFEDYASFVLIGIIENFVKSIFLFFSLTLVLFNAFCFIVTQRLSEKYEKGNQTHHFRRSEIGLVGEVSI